MIKKYISALLLMQLAMPALASIDKIPADLMFAGKPVDSLCFSTQKTSIDLRHCGAAKEKYSLKGINAELGKKGYTGYDWQTADASSQGYSYYQFFDAGKNWYWIYSINSGGGSGQFTAIQLVHRKDKDTLDIKAVTGGDRCNGGIQDVSNKNGQLNFSINLTAYDLITLANQKLPAVKAYDDLAACATCCVAKVFYEINTSLKPELTSLVLDKSTVNELPDQGSLQACFNKLFTAFVNKNELSLNQKKIDDFVEQFSQACVKAAK